MSYSSSGLHLAVPVSPTGSQVWVYKSTDAHGSVDAADYFSDGSLRGMRAEDIMIVIDTATATITLHRVESVTAGGAATIGASGA